MSVTFFADAGQIMVGARVACYTFGRFNVTLPEGKELATDEYDEGYTDGYLYRPPEHIHFDDFDFGFVQADVEVDVNAQWSDFEAVIDEAQKKVSEDVYFDADIEGPGLGRYKFGQHYRIGDIVRVGILGGQRYVTAPVTQVTHLPNGNPRVHVGGQAIRDLGLVEEQNRQVHQAIARAAAQNRHQLSQVASTASQAEKKIDQVLENIPDPTLFETYIQEAEEAVLSTQDFAAKAIAAADEADQLTIAMESKLGTVSEYVQRAASHVAAAQAAKDDVDAYAVAAAESAEDAFGYLEESRSLSQQNEKTLTQVNQYVEEVASAVASAAASAEQAFAYLGESQLVLDDVRGFSEVAEAAVADAQGFASKVAQTMDEADRVLVDSKTFRDQAQTAKAGAETALSQARGTLDQVVARHGEVLTWHQEMLAAHDETLSTHELVLKLHASGIRAASAAASQASAAVSVQGVVLQVHGQILELHEDAIEYATQTALDASKAAGEAGKAIEAQREIEKQQVLIDQKQDQAIAAATKTGQDAAKAASAAGNAATAAGAAAADATAVAKAVADAQAIQVDVNKKLAAGVRWAGVAAAQAAAATQSLASAVEEVDKATVLAQQTADDALKSARSAEDAGKIRDAFVKANNDAIWLVNFRALRKTALEVPIDVRKDYPLGSLGGLSLGMLKVYDSSGRNYLDFEYPDWQGAVSILIKPMWRGTGGSGFWTEIENRTPDTSSTTSVGLSRRDNWPPQNATHFSIEIELSPIWPRDARYQEYFSALRITDPVTGQVVPLA